MFHLILLLFGDNRWLDPVLDAILLRHSIDNRLDALLWEWVEQFVFLIDITVKRVERRIELVWLELCESKQSKLVLERLVGTHKERNSPAISFSAVRASHLSSRYLWSSLSDLIRRSIFGSRNFRNILLALAEINLKSLGVRLIGNDELCHAMYCLKRKSSIFAACQGRQPTYTTNSFGTRARERGKNIRINFMRKVFASRKNKRELGKICSMPQDASHRREREVPRQFETLRRRR